MLQQTAKGFPPDALRILVAVKGLQFGFVDQWFNKTVQYWMTDRGLAATQRQILGQITTIPFGSRYLIFAGASSLPLVSSKSSMLLIKVATVVAMAALASTPTASISIATFVMCILLYDMDRAYSAVFSSGLLSLLLNDDGVDGDRRVALTSATFLANSTFNVLGLLCAGLALWLMDLRVSFALLAIASMVVLLVMRNNYNKDMIPDMEKVTTPSILMVALYLGCASVVTALLPILGVSLPIALTVAAICAVGGVFAIDATLGRPIGMLCAFGCVKQSMSLNIGSTNFLFFTDPPSSFRDGPHLDPVFYVTFMGLLANVCVFIGIGFYHQWLKDWHIKRVFYLTYTLTFFAQLCALPLYLLWFRDEQVLARCFILLDEAFEVITNNLNDVPFFILVSAICSSDRGRDFAVFGLLGAATHLSMTVGTIGGTMLLQKFGVDPSGAQHEDHEFDNLWKVKLIRNSLTFVASVVATTFLLPEAKPEDEREQEYDPLMVDSPRSEDGLSHSGKSVDDVGMEESRIVMLGA